MSCVNIPVGGTTGLCHESSSQIDLAAQWIQENRKTAPRPLFPQICKQFGLTTIEVMEAHSQARELERGDAK